MSTAEVETNRATFKRFHEAANTGDVEFLFKTIDELVAPDAVIRTPLPIDAAGPQALKQVWAMLLRVYPDIHLTVEDLIAAGTRWWAGRR
jgi:ketosteroid isomerase-like protein